MIIKQQLINRIREYFNLNVYESKVWLALLAKGVASAGEISEISGVPRSRTYDVLESLEKRGFALIKLGKPIKYIAVNPDVVIEKLKTTMKKDVDNKIKNLSRLKDTLEYGELNQLYNEGINLVKQQEISGSIRGKSAIYTHLKKMLENAKREVIICTTTHEILSKSRFFLSVFEKLKKKNIKIKIALKGEEKDIKKINSKLKINAKPLDIESKFFIVDNSEILFVISKGDFNNDEIAIWLNTPFFASSLSFMFDRVIKIKENKA